MSDIRFVAPDAGGDGLFSKCLNEMVKDNSLMSKLARWGVHDYGNDADNYQQIVGRSSNLNKSYWVTETAGIENMFGQLDDNPTAFIFWDGFDCVYQHARRNGYGSVPPNDWVFWIGEPGKPLIAYNTTLQNWKPRKQFYEYTQLFKYIKPNATMISATSACDSLTVYSFVNPDKQLVIVGLNKSNNPVTLKGSLLNMSKVKTFKMVVTDKQGGLTKQKDVAIADGLISTVVPPKSVFTLIGKSKKYKK
jgi:O-glycosyl hydrolase